LRARPRGTPAPPSAPGDDWVNEDADRSLEVNEKAAARVRDAVTKGGGSLGSALKGIKREDILVVRGTFDKMEVVLETLKIPYTLVSPLEVAHGYDFTKHRLVFWNCTDPGISFPPRYVQGLLASLREFVRGGGFLFTSDWSVSYLLARAFPGYLETGGPTHPL